MLYLLVALLSLASAQLTGHYYGSKTIVFYDVKVNMQAASTPGFFSLSVTGAPGGNVNCPKEAYKLEGDQLSMPNYGTAGNCATEQFKAAGLKFLGATYDASAETITVHSQNTVLMTMDVTITCHKVSGLVANSLAIPSLEADDLVGHYYGEKTIVFYNVKINMKSSASDPGYFALSVTGAPGGNINCPKEKYSLVGSTLSMPNYGTPGNCATEQFKAAGLKFLGATYDASAETITVHSQNTVLMTMDVTITCHKVSGFVSQMLATKYLTAQYIQGNYFGSKTIVFYDVKVSMKQTGTPGYFALSVTGAPGGDVNCAKEAYTLEGTTLSMPNYGKPGNCATEQFKAAGLRFLGATYDASAQTITVKSQNTVLMTMDVTIVCHKAGDLAIPEATAPLNRILRNIEANN